MVGGTARPSVASPLRPWALPLLLVGRNAELVDLVLENAPGRTEQLGCAGLVVVGVLEPAQDEHALEEVGGLAEASPPAAHLAHEAAEWPVAGGGGQGGGPGARGRARPV